MLWSLLFNLFMTPALARTAYVGVASVGSGRGVLGHVFLTFAREPDQFLDAIFYQYTIQVPADFKFELTNVHALSNLPFGVETGPAWSLIKQYTTEDRAVILYELKLGAAAVIRLESRLEAERLAHLANPKRDFTLDQNCATKTFGALNQILGPGTFPIGAPTKLFTPLGLLHREGALMAIPILAAPRLDQHPLVRKRVVFRPGGVIAVQMGLAAIADLRPLFAACHISQPAQRILIRAFGNLKLRRSERYIRAYRALFADCRMTPELIEAYNAHLDVVRFGVNDPALSADVDQAYRRP